MADPPTTSQGPAVSAPSTSTNSQSPDPLLGRVINDRFKILSVIARGGMGKVYRAEQFPLGRIIALKVLNPNYQGDNDPEFHKRFTLEASTASRLHHPNTVTIFDYGITQDNIYFMAMEYLEGHTLHRLIRECSPLQSARAIHIVLQVCRSLREAHGLGVVHRDLKPANIFLLQHDDDPDYVKVLDFGLVKNVTDDGENLTQTGLFMGSPKYMAPEQIRGERVSPATDVYSLGVILYEMLTGKVPFDRPSSVNVLMAHVSEPVPPMQSVNPAVPTPHPLEPVVYRCLAKRSEDRYASMDDLISALKRTALAQGAAIGLSTSELLASMPSVLASGEHFTGSIPPRSPSSGSLLPAITESGSVPVSFASEVIPQSVIHSATKPPQSISPDEPHNTRRSPILLALLALFALLCLLALLSHRTQSPRHTPGTSLPTLSPATPIGPLNPSVQSAPAPAPVQILPDAGVVTLSAQGTQSPRATPPVQPHAPSLPTPPTLRAPRRLRPPPASPAIAHDPNYNPCFDAQDDSPACLRYRRAHPP